MLMRQRNKLSSVTSHAAAGADSIHNSCEPAHSHESLFLHSRAPMGRSIGGSPQAHNEAAETRERHNNTKIFVTGHGNGTHQGLNPNPNPISNHLTFTLECRERHWIRRFGPHTTRVSPAQVTLLNTIPDWCAHDCARAWREPLWSICLARLRRSVHMHRPDALGRHTHE